MSADLRFRKDMDVTYGEPLRLSPSIRRVVAENPSAFTFRGTGTYIVGSGKVAVIDPGPAIPAHIEALLRAVAGETVTHILITHTHIDHSPAAAALQAATGAPTYGFGPHPVPKGGGEVEEGGDHAFAPDVTVGDGDIIDGDGWRVEALHTPGHISNHLCFALPAEQALFSGDHVMGWSTSVISPPDGNMRDYFMSLRKLLPRDDRIFYPTHGLPIENPQALVRGFITHRRQREAQILACLARGPATIAEMVATMYREVPTYLHRAAARSVLAHLIHMAEDGRVVAEGAGVEERAIYRLP